MSYIKHFADKSADYLQFRPDYPENMYAFIIKQTENQELAWDCGTGNGQAANKLAQHFTQVIGSDVSQEQLDMAVKRNNITYHCWPAEQTGLANHSVDLITVAQALHWFNFDAFYQEVHRVAKKNAVIAAWCYSTGNMNNENISRLILKLYEEILGDKYWSKARKYIDKEYKTIPFPFEKQITPSFFIEKEMNLAQLIGYLNTWSGVKEYHKINDKNPLDEIYPELATNWGNPEKKFKMHWPIHLLLAKVND